MVLFFPLQQELDCISSNGRILGKIRFDLAKDKYRFDAADEETVLSELEIARIAERLAGLESGRYSIAMQDDD